MADLKARRPSFPILSLPFKNQGSVLRALSMLRRRRSHPGLYPSLSTVGCVGVLSPLPPESSSVRTLSYPSRPARPLCPLLKKMKVKTTTAPVALTEIVQSPLESVTGKNILSLGKKQSRTAQVKPSAPTKDHPWFHAERLSRVCAGKDTLRDVPQYAAPKLRSSSTCRRKLCRARRILKWRPGETLRRRCGPRPRGCSGRRYSRCVRGQRACAGDCQRPGRA